MIGRKFGRLTVLNVSDQRTSENRLKYDCICECGNDVTVDGKSLRNGHTKSCGCLSSELSKKRSTKHGKTNTRLYNIWSAMKHRCYNENDNHYLSYGGRGIKVCDEWLNDFQAFYNWSMNNGYKENLSIDRINNDKGYSPYNCRWADVETQTNNKQDTIKIAFNGLEYSIKQWSKILNTPYSTLVSRYHNDVDIKTLLTKKGNKCLYPHQVEVLGDLYHNKSAGIFYDMGLGKTIIGSIKATSYKMPILIIAPKSVCFQWLEHFKDWHKEYKRYNLTNKKDLESFIIDNDNLKVGVINYDVIYRRDELLKLKNYTLILDESQAISNIQSKRTKAIMKLKFENVLLLSGTPVSNSDYMKLYPMLKLLGLNMNKREYEDRYGNWFTMEMNGIKFRVLSKTNPYKNVDELKKVMHDLGCVFMKTDEVIDLPQQRFIDVPIKPSKYYKTFVKDGYVDCGEYEYISSSPTTDMLYQRQLCNSKEKLETLKTLLESTEDRVIIFYNFNCELVLLQQLVSKLKRPLSFVNGSEKNLNCYNNNNDSITLVQYQSGSSGVNLQKANKMIYYSPPIKSDFFEQSKKRIHRIGQESKCTYWKLVTTNSIEQKIYNTLDLKRDYTDELFRRDNEI